MLSAWCWHFISSRLCRDGALLWNEPCEPRLSGWLRRSSGLWGQRPVPTKRSRLSFKGPALIAPPACAAAARPGASESVLFPGAFDLPQSNEKVHAFLSIFFIIWASIKFQTPTVRPTESGREHPSNSWEEAEGRGPPPRGRVGLVSRGAH